LQKNKQYLNIQPVPGPMPPAERQRQSEASS